jgi:hypothetical protein
MPGSSSSSSLAGGAGRGVYLLRKAQRRFVTAAVDGFLLEIVAYGAHAMPKEIFRFQEHVEPRTGERVGEFDGVCSPTDLEEYAVGQARTGQLPAMFRSDSVSLVLRSRAEADEAWAAIDEEVRSLVATLNLMDDLEVAGVTAYGDPPAAAPPE